MNYRELFGAILATAGFLLMLIPIGFMANYLSVVAGEAFVNNPTVRLWFLVIGAIAFLLGLLLIPTKSRKD